MFKLIVCFILTFCFSFIVQGQNGVWERHAIDASLSGADGVRLADVNHDGFMDIATGWEESGYTKIYLHPGYGRVREKWPSVTVGFTPSVEDAFFMDLDNNGLAEVISCTEGDSRTIYILRAPSNPFDYLDSSKWRTEVLPASKNLMQWMFAIPAQIDGVNGLDIVAGAKGTGAKVGWFQSPENPENPDAWNWYPISSATWTMSLLIRDMDQDGDQDVVISDRKPGKTNGVRWLENPAKINGQKMEWAYHFIGCKDLEVMFMDMADLDGDGLEDAIATEYTNQKIVYMKRLDPAGLQWKSYPIEIPEITGRAKAVKVGDINGDGKPDLVHSTNTLGDQSKAGLYWVTFIKDPFEPVWEWNELSGTEGIKFDRIELLDLDGDGDLDVLTCEENYGKNSEGLGVIWYENPLGRKENPER